jgi:ketosteroid isomerase-like protein
LFIRNITKDFVVHQEVLSILSNIDGCLDEKTFDVAFKNIEGCSRQIFISLLSNLKGLFLQLSRFYTTCNKSTTDCNITPTTPPLLNCMFAKCLKKNNRGNYQVMKLLAGFLLITSFFYGCSDSNLTNDQKNGEKEKIKTRIEAFVNAYEKKDMNTVIAMLSTSNSFFFLGSDIAEKNYNISDFQNQMDHDWELFDNIDFGQIRNESIIISDSGDLAVAIYEIPVSADVGGSAAKFVLRMTNTFVKEKGMWQLVQGMASIPSVGESSAELIQKLK